MAKQLWRLIGLEADRINLASIHSAIEAVEYILKATEQKRLIMIAALWFTWSERNAIREEGRLRTSHILARSVEQYVKEMNMTDMQVAINASQGRRTARWAKSPLDTLKLNCDGSFHPESRAGSWGFLIRDHDGDVVTTGRGRLNHLLNPLQAKLVACLQDIEVAVSLGIGRILVETDAQEVVKAIKSNAYDNAEVGHLVDEVKFLLASNFLHFESKFANRECNRAAHELAALGYVCNEGEEVITASLPENVSVIVTNDLFTDE